MLRGVLRPQCNAALLRAPARSLSRLILGAGGRSFPLTLTFATAEGGDALSHFRNLQLYAEALARLDGGGDDSILLAAVLIARHANSAVDEAAVSQRLEELADGVRSKLGENRYVLKTLEAISSHMYEDCGFRGNSSDYYNPANSCIDQVLETRTGLPITLALVYMEIAERLGVPMTGVNVPTHFMLRPLSEDVEVLVDAFNGGRLCFQQDVEAMLSEALGYAVSLDRDDMRGMERLPPRLFLYRMLTNLKHVYLRSVGSLDPAKALKIIGYMRVTVPGQAADQRDEGLCLYAMGRQNEAVMALSEYLRMYPDADDATRIRGLILDVQSRSAPDAE